MTISSLTAREDEKINFIFASKSVTLTTEKNVELNICSINAPTDLLIKTLELDNTIADKGLCAKWVFKKLNLMGTASFYIISKLIPKLAFECGI